MNALGRHLVTMGLMELEPSWFEVFMTHFRAYKAEKGHCKVPLKHKCPDDYKLGMRVSGIREGNNQITDAQRAELDALGFLWNGKEWYPEFIQHLRAFKAEHGHCRVHPKLEYPKGYPIGRKVRNIRSGNNQITDAQRAELDALGFVWNGNEWYPEFIQHLRAFQAEYGHCQVRTSLEYPKGYNIGTRVDRIRQNKPKLTDEQRSELEALGFIWDATRKGGWWPEFIRHLRAFKIEHGHCQVPTTICHDGYKLGMRVAGIRRGNNQITDEQRAELDALGFVWDAQHFRKDPLKAASSSIWRAAKKSQRVGSP